jgi:cell division transport system ATP-binding protein
VTKEILVQLKGVTKSFLGKKPIFSNLDLTIERGEFLFLTGVSGAGKSTVFRLIMGLETPDRGSVEFDGVEVNKIPRNKIPYHRRSIGMVFQDYKLLENKTTENNISIPLRICGTDRFQRDKKIKQIASLLNLDHLLKQKIKTLSGGEQQLVAIARAAVHSPKIILADEPTANLDHKTAKIIISTLLSLNERGTAVVIATHDIQLIKSMACRILLLKDSNVMEVT